MSITIIHSQALSQAQQARVANVFGTDITPGQSCYRIQHAGPVEPAQLSQLADELQVDINTLPEGFDPQAVRLVISDMDSTLINIECVDEIADFIGVKPQVAAITEAAMRGELDFEASLTQRVKLLKGLDVSALQHVYDERLRLNPGAEDMLSGLKARSVKMALVSGGFTFFTDRLQNRLELDYTLANVLGVESGRLTGEVMGNIVGAQAKAEFLQHLCDVLDISLSQTIAIGDGANDLKMLGLAGLGVAYYAKPKVREQADVCIQHGSLATVLDFLT